MSASLYRFLNNMSSETIMIDKNHPGVVNSMAPFSVATKDYFKEVHT